MEQVSRDRLKTLQKERDRSELEAIAGLQRRLETAIAGLQAMKSQTMKPITTQPRPLHRYASSGLLLAEAQSTIAGQRQRERGEIENECKRKAQAFQLSTASVLPKAPPSQRPSLAPSEGHLSRYPTATSLLSPKSFPSQDLKDLERELKHTQSRCEAQERTISSLKQSQDELQLRLSALEQQGSERETRGNEGESRGKEAGKERKYMQEFYIMRKRKEQEKARRWLEKEKAWALDLDDKYSKASA